MKGTQGTTQQSQKETHKDTGWNSDHLVAIMPILIFKLMIQIWIKTMEDSERRKLNLYLIMSIIIHLTQGQEAKMTIIMIKRLLLRILDMRERFRMKGVQDRKPDH